MQISVPSCDFARALHAACKAKHGHDVVGIDVDQPNVVAMAASRPFFFELDLEEMWFAVQTPDELQSTADMARANGRSARFGCAETPRNLHPAFQSCRAVRRSRNS